MIHSTAILLFTRPASEEARAKTLFPTQADKAFDGLISHAIATIRQTKLPYFVHTEQVGQSFAERFTHAIQKIFDQGYERVITIGNDSPELTAGMIRKADQLLQNRSLVMGKSQDGGAYLIGIQKEVFDPEAFVDLPWQTECVAEALVDTFDDHEVLPLVLRDLDNSWDFQRLIATHASTIKGMLFAVLQLFSSSMHPGVYPPLRTGVVQVAPCGLRAPPTYLG